MKKYKKGSIWVVAISEKERRLLLRLINDEIVMIESIPNRNSHQGIYLDDLSQLLDSLEHPE